MGSCGFKSHPKHNNKLFYIMAVSRQRKKATKKKKHVYTPCTDTNQRVREANAEKRRQNDALIKKIADIRAHQEMARRQLSAMGGDATASEGVIDGLSTATE